MTSVRPTTVVLFFIILCGLAGSPPAALADPSRSRPDVIADVAEAVLPAVVNIATTRVQEMDSFGFGPFGQDPMFRQFFGQPFEDLPRQFRQEGSGSGVIVSEDGVVLTNSHVVASAESIEVTLHDGREFVAELLGSDPRSDVAVLRLVDAEGLTPLALGDSDELRLGETVLAFGNPFGLSGTVTMGIVSAMGRADVGIVDYEDFIQTDAAINPGNSGGALVNLRGELVGVNTAIMSRSGGYQGIGFAIPSNMVGSIMRSLLTDGRVARGWLGVMIQDLRPGLAEAFEVETTEGVLVGDVVSDSPAQAAGVRRGDVIVALDGAPVASAAALRNAVGGLSPGSKVKMKLLRDGKSKLLTVKLGELPGDDQTASTETRVPNPSGLTVAPLDAAARARHDVPEDIRQGVLVTEVQPLGTAARAGMRPGDVVLEVNRTPVGSVESFSAAAAEGGNTLLLVWRDGGTRWVVLDD